MLEAVLKDEESLDSLRYYPPIYENNEKIRAEKWTGKLLDKYEEIHIPTWLVKWKYRTGLTVRTIQKSLSPSK